MAQIATDGSLGPARILQGPAFDIPASLGKSVGPNLFHSFRQFNLNLGEQATFSGPPSTANVVTRVTGGEASSLNGTLRCSIPSANFFLVNPAGVVFGPDAKIDVDGSFSVTTADEIRLAGGGRFDARAGSDDLLTTAPPSAFGFLPTKTSPGIASVEVHGSRLGVRAGHDLTVAAGAIAVDSGSTIEVPNGNAQLAAVGSRGDLPVDGLDTAEFDRLGNIRLVDGGKVEVGREGRGRFIARAQNLTLQGSDLTTMEASGIHVNVKQSVSGETVSIDVRGQLQLNGGEIVASAARNADGGEVAIRAAEVALNAGFVLSEATDSSTSASIRITTDKLSIAGPLAGIDTYAEAEANAGAIAIAATSVMLREGEIGSQAMGTGRAGSVDVQAGTISMGDDGYASIFSNSLADHGGPSGQITIKSQVLELAGASEISSTSYGSGDAGGIWIDAETISLDGRDGFASIRSGPDSFEGIGGEGGDITIRATDLRVVGGDITSDTFGIGDAGGIMIETDKLLVDGRESWASISSASEPANNEPTAGAAGAITIHAREFRLLGGVISSTTAGSGLGGDITIRADSLIVDGAGEFADISSGPSRFGEPGPSGSGGDIDIEASEVRLLNSGAISSATDAEGASGNIRLRARSLVIDGAEITSGSENFGPDEPAGSGGAINIEADSMELRGGEVSSAAWGTGDGGPVHIKVHQDLIVRGGSISSAAEGEGRANGLAGSVTVDAGTIEVTDQGKIRTATAGANQGGDLTVRATESIVVDGGWISAGAESTESTAGRAGSVSLMAPVISLLGDTQIESSTIGPAPSGPISIQATRLDLVGDLRKAVTISSGTSGEGGDGGNIRIEAGDIHLMNSSDITSSTDSSGQAGDIDIVADRLRLERVDFLGGITSESTYSGESTGGKAGNIHITVGDLDIEESGSISSATWGSGAGGTVVIQAQRVRIAGPGALVTAHSEGREPNAGSAGDVLIQARALEVTDTAEISSDSYGSAPSGSVTLVGSDRVHVTSGLILVKSAEGSAGSLVLKSEGPIVIKNSEVAADAWINGGDIHVEAGAFGLIGGVLEASAEKGNGGHISILSGLYFELEEPHVDYRSRNQSAEAGTLTIQSALDLAGSLVVLQGEVETDSAEVRESCFRRNPRANILWVRGKGGVSATPESLLYQAHSRLR